MPTDSSYLDIVKLMQSSIVPVTVISGVGLILLSMTNRYGRIIDRTHFLIREIEKGSGSGHEMKNITEQIKILYRRARHQRSAIVLCSSSVFFVALSIFFLYAHLKWDYGAALAEFFFFGSLITLILSMAIFIADILISLKALKMEIDARVQLEGKKTKAVLKI